MNKTGSRLAWAALLVSACAALAMGAQLPGYNHLVHPLGLPGARGMPGAGLFNAMVYVLPGAMMALVCWWLRPPASAAGGATRVGAALLLWSALAFAAQGLLPLRLDALEAGASRLHMAAWTAWWIAGVSGAALLAATAPGLRLAMAVGAVVMLANAPLAGLLLPGPVAQRLACVAWFVAVAVAASRGLSRGAASGRG